MRKKLVWIFFAVMCVVAFFLFKDSYILGKIIREYDAICQAEVLCIEPSVGSSIVAHISEGELQSGYQFIRKYELPNSVQQIATLHFFDGDYEIVTLRLLAVPEEVSEIMEMPYNGRKYLLSGNEGITKFLCYSIPDSLFQVILRNWTKCL